MATSNSLLGASHPFALVARVQLAAILRGIGGAANEAEAELRHALRRARGELGELTASKLAAMPTEGYMQKKGHMRQDWKRRYIVWTPLDRSLVWYSDETKKSKKGSK